MIELLVKAIDEGFVQTIAQSRVVIWASVTPESKQSTRFGQKHAYTDPDKLEYATKLARQFSASLKGKTFKGFISVKIVYCFPILKGDTEWSFHGVRPDLDNLEKPVLDALKIVLENDDSKIVHVDQTKIRFLVPCIVVIVESCRENPDIILMKARI